MPTTNTTPAPAQSAEPARYVVRLGISSFGNDEPRMLVWCSASSRITQALTLRAAADVEMASEGRGDWIVVVDRGALHLELIHCSDAEVGAAMRVLSSVADRLNSAVQS